MKSLLAQHSVSLTLKRNPTIRRQVNDIEDLVKEWSEGGFAQPQVIPVPDEFDPSVPRMIFESKAGHSQLLISQASVVFNVRYSPDWSMDHKKCVGYLKSKIDLLFNIVEKGWGGSVRPFFVGVSTKFNIPADSQADAVKKLASVFADKLMLAEKANELSYRWSLNVDDKFYDNIAVSTQVFLKEQEAVTSDGVPRFNSESIDAYGVELVGDYNDRLSFNLSEGYRSDISVAKQMIDAGFDSVKGAVAKFEEGEEK